MTAQRRSDDQGEHLMGVTGSGGLAVVWRKSSHSNHQSACVEMGRLDQGTVGFRDSKDPEGAVLTFERAAVQAFVAAVAAGEFTGRR